MQFPRALSHLVQRFRDRDGSARASSGLPDAISYVEPHSKNAPPAPLSSEPENIPPPPWPHFPDTPWAPPTESGTTEVRCNICRWEGSEFVGPAHCEFAQCPRCGSIARDRFLFHCLTERTTDLSGSRLLETSPRLKDDYRAAMAQWFDYVCSDYDESAHRGMIQLDLQDTGLPNESFDVILSPHVLEHVPDTDLALGELWRILAPGGRLILQVPIQQGATAPPVTEEFHGDNTPVFWRFGFDFTRRLEASGFEVATLVPEKFRQVVTSSDKAWDVPRYPEFAVDEMLNAATPTDLTVVADTKTTSVLGFAPEYMFLTWECVKPTTTSAGY